MHSGPGTSTHDPPCAVAVVEGNYADGDRDTSFVLYKNEELPAERIVVFAHGGGWAGGDKAVLPAPLKAMVDHGFAVASIDYPLHGITRHPKQARFVKDALAYFEDQEEELGVDGDDPVVAGFSAGGHLAALAATTSGEPSYAPHDGATEVRPEAVVLMAAPFDLLQVASGGGRPAAEPK